MGHLVDFCRLKLGIQTRDNIHDRRFRLEIRGQGNALFDQLENVIAVLIGEEVAALRDLAWPECCEFRMFRVQEDERIIKANRTRREFIEPAIEVQFVDIEIPESALY
tara:strand:+ start:606 stop:929 length:324 start_codon:yes stop_codon:yes gene_type:complete